MKIIHTADLHLDSKMERHLDTTRASERRNELLSTFRNIIAYGRSNGAEAILISGDLFDTGRISATTRDAVISGIVNNPEIVFYYLRGNHDEGSFLSDMQNRVGMIPENLRIFNDNWTSYSQRGADGTEVVISGAEITDRNNGILASGLVLDQNAFNIVMLHGQENDSSGKKDGYVIPLRDYQNKGIDYMALGHIHLRKEARLDARGIYVYPGCPEGRGFDECGSKGFYLLEIANDPATGLYILSKQFVPIARRQVYDMKVNVEDALTDDDVAQLIREAAALAGVRNDDLLKARMTGAVDMDAAFNPSFIKSILEDDFYVIKVVNETVAEIDYSSFAYDESLKGEFVRMVNAAKDTGELEENEAAEIIQLGIRLLRGENIG